MRLAVTILIASVAGLTTLGFLMLYSAGMQSSDGLTHVTRQAAAAFVGICGAFVCAKIDHRHWRKLGPWVVALAVALLVLVLIPGIGVYKNGARRWFDLGVTNFQPSELGKIALIMLLALTMERWQRYNHTWGKGCFAHVALGALIIVPIFLEPDRGTAILLCGVSAAIFLTGGMRWRALTALAVVGVAAFAFVLLADPVRRGRIDSWVKPELHREGKGYQAWQASIALGAGGSTGVGLGNGRQKLGFVPEHHTDFIFSVVGEELGLGGTLGVVGAYVLICLSGLYISWRAKTTFGVLLGTGITSLIGMQALINIGVVTGSIPNKGLPLPFMSYGGTSIVLMFSCVGILLNIARVSSEAEELVEQSEPMLALEEATA